MKTQVLLLVGVLALFCPPVWAAPEVGEKAPEFSAVEWYNLPSGLKSLEATHTAGQIVLLEFWATWCGPCRENIPHMIRLHEKYKPRGVVVVALSDEPDGKVKPFIEKHKMTYIVGGSAKATQTAYEVTAIPAAFLIDPDGKLAWKGNPAVVEAALERLLKEKPPRAKGVFAEASARDSYRTAEKLYDQRRYGEALDNYNEVARRFKGTDYAKRAKERAGKMRANSRIMDIVEQEKAERVSEGWLTVARGCAMYGDKEDAIKYYKRIISKYPNTNQAKLAQAEKKTLEE